MSGLSWLEGSEGCDCDVNLCLFIYLLPLHGHEDEDEGGDGQVVGEKIFHIRLEHSTTLSKLGLLVCCLVSYHDGMLFIFLVNYSTISKVVYKASFSPGLNFGFS